MRELGDPVDEIWGDESVRQTYNFAPGYTGLVYRATTASTAEESHENNEQSSKASSTVTGSNNGIQSSGHSYNTKSLGDVSDFKYVLQAMRWGVCVRFLTI